MFLFLLSSTTLLIFFDIPLVPVNDGGFGVLFISKVEEFDMRSKCDEVDELRDNEEEQIVDEPILIEEVFEVVSCVVVLCLSMISSFVLLFDLNMESFFLFLLLRIFFIYHNAQKKLI